MAPRKTVKKMKDVAECSPAASKRRRVQFSEQITTHLPPSAHFSSQPPLQTTAAEVQFSPPSPFSQAEEPAVDDGLISSLIPQQNFVIGYHVTQMLKSVEDFWRQNVGNELKKLKEKEAALKEKDRQVAMVRRMYYFYEDRTFHLEEELRRRVEGEGTSNAVVHEEQVESCLVDFTSSAQRMDMMCKNCRNRPATMLWLPCRHLCVCLMCERRVKTCPMCGVQKTETLMVNLPRH